MTQSYQILPGGQMPEFDAAIIGAGPAGLAAANMLLDAGCKAIVLESGDFHPDRTEIEGVGGAGLYSDGKFSFFPAGTATWKLLPPFRLELAYTKVREILGLSGIEGVPAWSDVWSSVELNQSREGKIEKHYRSIYVDLESRIRLIQDMARAIELMPRSTVTRIVQDANSNRLAITSNDSEFQISAKSVILATGRLWNSRISHAIPTVFRRYEFGVRLEQPADTFLFANHPDVDPKWIYSHEGPRREYRTFCCCREGTIVDARTGSGVLLSGRADGARTRYSNLGVMVRYLDALDHYTPPIPTRFAIPAQALVSDNLALGPVFGAEASAHLAEAIIQLSRDTQNNLADATLHGPCLEGVGQYPEIDTTTLVAQTSRSAWVAGDATGLFRGLVPALVSGAFAGMAVVGNESVS